MIKFRAWDSDMKTMRDCDNLVLHGVYLAPSGVGFVSVGDQSFHRLDGFIPMMFTGLHDKNGKEIYNGDIISTETDKPMVVSWNERFASFCLDRDGWAFSHWFGEAVNNENVLVIGNIHENPELL